MAKIKINTETRYDFKLVLRQCPVCHAHPVKTPGDNLCSSFPDTCSAAANEGQGMQKILQLSWHPHWFAWKTHYTLGNPISHRLLVLADKTTNGKAKDVQ